MKYLCFYDTVVGRRKIKMASVNKINYICSALNQIGVDVELVSCSMTAPQKLSATVERLNDHTTVRFFRTAKEARWPWTKILQLIRRNITLFFYLLFNTDKGETVAVYHSLINMRCIRLAKRIKRFKLLLEVEEIYNDVFLRSNSNQRAERAFIDCAEMYLFPTNILADKVNTAHKPQAVVYGAYEAVSVPSATKKRGDKIRVAYTGSFDPNKGGLNAALEAAKYLGGSYVLHILGTDTPERVRALEEYIELHSEKDSCRICYDGVRRGKEYTDYLFGMDIGLSTQNPDAGFNDSSFPSKVISYLSCGLRVVSYPIRVLTESELHPALYYYTENTPQSIADAVKRIDLNAPYDGRAIIDSLDVSFKNQLLELRLNPEENNK